MRKTTPRNDPPIRRPPAPALLHPSRLVPPTPAQSRFSIRLSDYNRSVLRSHCTPSEARAPTGGRPPEGGSIDALCPQSYRRGRWSRSDDGPGDADRKRTGGPVPHRESQRDGRAPRAAHAAAGAHVRTGHLRPRGAESGQGGGATRTCRLRLRAPEHDRLPVPQLRLPEVRPAARVVRGRSANAAVSSAVCGARLLVSPPVPA